jgi:hypothetical protein
LYLLYFPSPPSSPPAHTLTLPLTPRLYKWLFRKLTSSYMKAKSQPPLFQCRPRCTTYYINCRKWGPVFICQFTGVNDRTLYETFLIYIHSLSLFFFSFFLNDWTVFNKSKLFEHWPLCTSYLIKKK